MGEIVELLEAHLPSERWAIFIEIIAFFFVTIDLYGEPRLAHLTHAFIGFLDRLLRTIVKTRRALSSKRGYLLIGYLVLGFAASLAKWALTAADLLPTRAGQHTIGEYIYIAILAPATVAFVAFLTLIMLGNAVAVVVFAFSLGKRLLQAMRLRGLLLTLGTFLFLASKAIAWLHAHG